MGTQFTKTQLDGLPPAGGAGAPNGLVSAAGGRYVTLTLVSGGPAKVKVWAQQSTTAPDGTTTPPVWVGLAEFSFALPGDSGQFPSVGGGGPTYAPGACFYAKQPPVPGVRYTDPTLAAQLSKGNASTQFAVADQVPPDPKPTGSAITSPFVFVQLIGGAGGTFEVD